MLHWGVRSPRTVGFLGGGASFWTGCLFQDSGKAFYKKMPAFKVRVISHRGVHHRGQLCKNSNTAAMATSHLSPLGILLSVWVPYEVRLMLLNFLCFITKVIRLHYREASPFCDPEHWALALTWFTFLGSKCLLPVSKPRIPLRGYISAAGSVGFCQRGIFNTHFCKFWNIW